MKCSNSTSRRSAETKSPSAEKDKDKEAEAASHVATGSSEDAEEGDSPASDLIISRTLMEVAEKRKMGTRAKSGPLTDPEGLSKSISGELSKGEDKINIKENDGPCVSGQDSVKAPWNNEEVRKLLLAYKEQGSRWTSLVRLFPGRSQNDLKNKFYGTLKVFASRAMLREPTKYTDFFIKCKQSMLQFVDIAIEKLEKIKVKRGRKKRSEVEEARREALLFPEDTSRQENEAPSSPQPHIVPDPDNNSNERVPVRVSSSSYQGHPLMFPQFCSSYPLHPAAMMNTGAYFGLWTSLPFQPFPSNAFPCWRPKYQSRLIQEVQEVPEIVSEDFIASRQKIDRHFSTGVIGVKDKIKIRCKKLKD